MGRPLKISKATILSLTNTTAGNGVVTFTPANTSIVKNMPFKIATTTGNLTAGTTYYVLSVVNSTNFTVSATDLSANPSSTPQVLTTAGPVTVNMTVAPTDTGWDNPIGSANTYGVVGGNSAQFGNQVQANVAIGIAGNGTIWTITANNQVYGSRTDFANTAKVGYSIEASVTDRSSTTLTTIGYVSVAGSLKTVTVANSTATGNFFLVSAGVPSSNLIPSQPFVFTANTGGLLGNTVYFVGVLSNATAFTVAAQPGGANLPLTNDTGNVTTASQDSLTLNAVAPAATFRGANWVYANNEIGYVVRQKGATKYLVTGLTTGLTSACYTANLASANLTSNTMRIITTGTPVNVQALNDYNSALFGAGNVRANATHVIASTNANVAANAAAGRPYAVAQITTA